MTNDRQITITVGASRKSTEWRPQTLSISEFYEKLRVPARGTETINQYLSLPKSKQDELKDVGGYVAGALSGLRRKAGAVTGRDVVTLDLDNIPPGWTNEIHRRVAGLGCGYCIYSTRKHQPAAPRLRVLLPLDRTATPDEYEAAARKLAELIGMEFMDPSTFEPSRLMYWGSACADGEYIFRWEDKPMASLDGVLGLYVDWHDMTSWPGGADAAPKRGRKMEDPTAKEGVVGAFCRIYDIEGAMAAFLPGVYEETTTPGRYTYTGGSTAGGAVVYDGGKYLFSHHATDPCGGREVNAFDLVRLHLFGDRDDGAKAGTFVHQLPSYKAMEQLCREDPPVKALLEKERGEKVLEAFKKIDTPVDSGDLVAFLGGIKGDFLTVEMVRDLMRLLGIHIRLNEITWHVEVSGYPKAWSKANAENLLPTILLDYLRVAGVKGAAKGAVCDALDVIAEEDRYNPVKDMLLGTAWDKKDRLDELFDIWKVHDPFSQLLTRKWLIQCVAMALNDEMNPQGAEGILVPQGEQGYGKTSILRELVPLPRMFKTGARLDMREKDTYIQALNCWICELGELDRTTVKDSAGLKAFITQDLDEYRTPYSRKAVQRPRRTSFCGTVNPAGYLVDETGNRRYFTIRLAEKVDVDRLFSLTKEWKCQLWAEVYAMYQRTPQGFRLTDREREQLEELNLGHTKPLDFELELREVFDWDLPEKDWGEFSAVEVSGRLKSQPPANKLGRVLAKLAREDGRLSSRNLHGRILYTLPMNKAQNLTALRVL